MTHWRVKAGWLKRMMVAVVTGKWHRLKDAGIASDYMLLDPHRATQESLDGWHERAVADRQDAAYRVLIRKMREEQPRQDFEVAAEAVRLTRLEDPSILEVGCGSGYYSEVLTYLLAYPVRYTGLDYSASMIRLAAARYPDRDFVVGDATALPFDDDAFDIVFNGVSLMHIPQYEAAIAEARRVARGWCIFHTVPVLKHRPTTFLKKKAYGEPTVEVIFNEGALQALLATYDMKIRQVLDSIPYNLEAVLGEPTTTKTFVCEV